MAKKIFSCLGLFFIATLITACKVAGERPDITPTDSNAGNAVYSYMISEQYAINVNGLANNLSGLQGYALLADKSSTFEAWLHPQYVCRFESEDAVNVQPIRRVDIGQISLSGFSIQETQMPRDPKSFIFGVLGHLPAGIYHVNNSGNSRGTYAFTQDFVVPGAGSGIKLSVGEDGAAQNLPTPNVPNSGDADWMAVVKTNSSLKVEYSVPENTTYVRTMIFDGSNKPEGAIVCYSPPTTPTVIPADMLKYFRHTDDGAIYVDFVNANIKTDAPGIQESFIQSYTRHLHGMQEYLVEGQKLTARFGVLRFE